MSGNRWMRRFARWHIWLGWLVGVPIVMWLLTGLVMVARPIEEVRGEHLRLPVAEETLPPDDPIPIDFTLEPGHTYSQMRVIRQDGRSVWLLTRTDGSVERVKADLNPEPLPVLDDSYARALVQERIVGGDRVRAVTAFDADDVPFDFRRAEPVWQVALANGANVYVNRDTGEIAAIRTRYWRVFDFMWGLHIMDLGEREDTSHPTLIVFAALSLIGALLGTILMFRRRRRARRA